MSDHTPTTSYDEVPYVSTPFVESHPDRLATVATLFGLQPSPVERCRVLELGCASGGNLIPMAEELHHSTFVGVDNSQRQIADGQEAIASLGLTNIELRQMSISDVGRGLGEFDYIISHGVYSYLPPDVQDNFLDVCKHNLAANGIAYVSYNTLPGWHMRGMIRDMMIYHTRGLPKPTQRIEQARALLDFLAGNVRGAQNPYALLLKLELEFIQENPDFYIFHEHLEDRNEAIYFHQFAERVAAKGLRYLGEADISAMVPGHFAPDVARTLQKLSADLLHLEQYMDFLRNRMFRATLLCHPSQAPSYVLQPDCVHSFHVASPLQPAAALELSTNRLERFDTPKGSSLTTQSPIVKAALVILGEMWPRTCPFAELLALAQTRLDDGSSSEEDARELGKALLHYYTAAPLGLVELRRRPLTAASDAGDRPVARPLARWQAERNRWATNFFHEMVTLGEFERQILLLLDGNRDRLQIIEALADRIQRHGLTVTKDGQPVKDPILVRRFVEEAVAKQLPQFARAALLVS